jgi:hypothetical protein
MIIDVQLLDEYLDIRAQRDAAKLRLDEIEERKGEIESRITAMFRESGMQSVNRHGQTISIRRDLSVASKNGDTAAVVDKLRRARLGDLICVNWRALPSRCRQWFWRDDLQNWEIDMNKLPPSLRDVVQCEERYSVSCRKS